VLAERVLQRDLPARHVGDAPGVARERIEEELRVIAT
jgi:hypothetical protein